MATKKKPKKDPAAMGGKMLIGVSKTKPGMGGASKKSPSKMVKHKKAMY